jgi:RIO-like serine/threonine protein kinase
LLTAHESTLDVFRKYLVSTGEMLCFSGPNLEEHQDSLKQMTALGLLTKENVSGGYSLTKSGFTAMSGSGNN